MEIFSTEVFLIGYAMFSLAVSLWPIRSEPIRSDPCRSRNFSVLVVLVSRYFSQAMKSCRNLMCSLF